MVKTKRINILFVCRYNRFRSRVAAAYFAKINLNKRIRIKSAGVIRGSPVIKNQVRLAREFGINIKGSPRGLSSKLLKWQDIVVVVADDVPESLFTLDKKYDKKTIFWKIPDTVSDNNDAEVRKIIKKVIKKVDGLVKELGDGK